MTGLTSSTPPTRVASAAARPGTADPLITPCPRGQDGDPAVGGPRAGATARPPCPPPPPAPRPGWSGTAPCRSPTPYGCAGRPPAVPGPAACSPPTAPCPAR